jgi:hypothetical protein
MMKCSSQWHDCTSEVRALLHQRVSDSPTFLPTRLHFLICYRFAFFFLLFPFFTPFNFCLCLSLTFCSLFFTLSCNISILPHLFPFSAVYPINVLQYAIITSSDMREGTINFRLTGRLQIPASWYRISTHGGKTENHDEYIWKKSVLCLLTHARTSHQLRTLYIGVLVLNDTAREDGLWGELQKPLIRDSRSLCGHPYQRTLNVEQ